MRHFSNSSKRDGASHPPAPKRPTMRLAFLDEEEDNDDDDDDDDYGDKMEAEQPNNNTSRFKSGVDNKNSDEKMKEEEEEEEEDDYMTMTFADTPSQPETSLQRRQRLQKEGLRRGMVPSKAQLAEQERERREQGLSRSLFSAAGPDEGILLGEKIAAERRRKAERAQQDAGRESAAAAAVAAAAKNTKSKGLAMMAKMGFTPGSALGRREREDGEAMVEPLRIQVREDRGGIGLGDERKRKLREALPLPQLQQDDDDDDPPEGQNKKTKIVDEGDYRERMAKEREVARKERLVHAAQKIAERMDEDKRGAADEEEGKGGKGAAAASSNRGGGGGVSRPLKAVPVLYRGLVRHREEAERDRRARHDLEQSSGFPDSVVKLPRYAEDEDDLDAYDRMALGKGGEEEGLLQPPDSGISGKDEKKKKPVYMPVDDLDEEDDELDTFNALEVDERLAQLVKYLREEFRYCFWCKFAYPDEAMEGCPGITEEDHD